jgi:Arc/MetJ-type ribon-helix-helix transcriptional regulator
MTERITFSMPDDMAEDINARLSYGDNRSEWIRDAIREKLERDGDEPPQEIRTADQPPTRNNPLADLTFPQGRDRDACLNAIHAARDYLEREGSATMREIVTAIQPDHSLGYDVVELDKGERYRGAWWRKVVKPGLESLEDVEKPSGGQREWRWVG